MEPLKSKAPSQPRPTFVTTVSMVVNNTTQLIEASRRELDQIVAETSLETATFDNVLLPMAHCRDHLAVEARILSFYKEASSDADLRQESRKSKLLFDNFETEISMREDLFLLVDSVVKKNQDLDLESKRLLWTEHRTFKDNGLALPKDRRARFREIKLRLNEATSEFRKNMIEENGSVEFSAGDMDGVPADVLRSARLNDDLGKKTEKFRLTFQPTHFYPLMRYARSSETRKSYLIAYENRCKDNVLLFREIVLLRDEVARMLGYANHATWRTEGLITGTPENVLAFLQGLRSRLQYGCQAEIRALKKLKCNHLRDQGFDFDNKFYVWDISFYHRLMLETQFSVDQKRIAEYFPIQTVVLAMLGIFEHVFSLDFRSVSIETTAPDNLNQTWHEDVQIFDVWDSDDIGGSFLGYLYLDLYTREGKCGNAANFNLQPGFLKPDKSRYYPSTALICNFNKPLLDEPSLLQHHEVCLLFHELGHGIHDLVAKTKYSRFHGTATVDDFCEAPSQMLEKWCWKAPQLKTMSRHYSTLTKEYHEHWKRNGTRSDVDPSEQIPLEQIEALIRSQSLNAAITNMRSLWRSVFDIKVHAPPDRATLEHLDITREFKTLQKQIVGLDEPEDDETWGHGQAHFSHLVGGYDSSFYGYLFSRVYASDLFATAFEKDPMDREVGRRYRRTVLEKGGSVDEMSLLIEFLGRAPSSAAFDEELGIGI